MNKTYKEDDERNIYYNNNKTDENTYNNVVDDNYINNNKNKIIFQHFRNTERKTYYNGMVKGRELLYKNIKMNENKNNQISNINLTNYLLVPDEIRHKYTKTYLFQISKRLLVMKKTMEITKKCRIANK